MQTALFLGAGASFDLGMPLVWDLTSELKHYLTSQRLKELNENWRAQGGGYHNYIINDLIGVLSNTAMHYEGVLGYVEAQSLRQRPFQQKYDELYARIVELVYLLLYERHVRNKDYIRRGLRYIEGIVGLAEVHSPLWVFSLNHDLVIECLAAEYGIPLNCGFSDSISLPLDSQAAG